MKFSVGNVVNLLLILVFAAIYACILYLCFLFTIEIVKNGFDFSDGRTFFAHLALLIYFIFTLRFIWDAVPEIKKGDFKKNQKHFVRMFWLGTVGLFVFGINFIYMAGKIGPIG